MATKYYVEGKKFWKLGKDGNYYLVTPTTKFNTLKDACAYGIKVLGNKATSVGIWTSDGKTPKFLGLLYGYWDVPGVEPGPFLYADGRRSGYLNKDGSKRRD